MLTPPDENEIKAQWRRERIVENNKCEFAKQEIEDLERSLSPDHFDENEIQAKYKNLISTRDETCRDRKILVKNRLSRQTRRKKRECKNNKQSMQFICTEKIRTNQGKISKKEWDEWTQENQSYFAYK